VSRAAPEAAAAPVPVRFNQIDEGYFAALSVRLLAGRTLAPREDDVVIVNAALARRFWESDAAAIGHSLYIPPRREGTGSRRMLIVGVVATIQSTNIGMADEPTYYTALDEREARTAFLLVRVDEGVPFVDILVKRVREIDPSAYIMITSLDARIAEVTTPALIGVAVAGLIGLLALGVAAAGIHGVIAHAVTSRTREIGIYQALGAGPSDVLQLIAGWTLRGVMTGLSAALLIMIAFGFTLRAPLREVLHGLSPLDPVSLAAASAVLILVIGIAAYVPARRALRVTPITALRHD
jgi:putative ABC transport system permease protein